MSLTDTIMQQLSGDTLTRMSQQIGADPSQVQNAATMALPLLLGGLAHNASQPEGAQALHQALDQHDGSALDDVAGLVSNPQAFAGGGILGHIFGSRQDQAAQTVGRASGLDSGQMMKLLMMLAPMVMAYLGRAKRNGQLGQGQLGDVLHQERTQAEQRAPGGIGDIIGSMFGGKGGGGLGGMLGGMLGGR